MISMYIHTYAYIYLQNKIQFGREHFILLKPVASRCQLEFHIIRKLYKISIRKL